MLPKNARMLQVLKAFEEEELELVDELGPPVATVPAPQGKLESREELRRTETQPEKEGPASVGADWTQDDDEPAVVESTAPAAAETAATPAADVPLPTCPTCKGEMWDNR